tara:strand:- start:51 stop:500 length:450 start_codon:yes stop_codon:yes gene_type:complete
MDYQEIQAIQKRMANRPCERIAKAIVEKDAYLKVGQAEARKGRLYLKGKQSFVMLTDGFIFSLRGREDATAMRYFEEVISETYFQADVFGENDSANEDMHIRKTNNGVFLQVGHVKGDSFRVCDEWKIDPMKMYSFSWDKDSFELETVN